MKFRSLVSPAALLCVLLLATIPVLADDWRPLNPAELAMKTPLVDKDADAEAILWDVRVDDNVEGGTVRTVLKHYIRIKIFTERGRESQSKIDIPFYSNWSISDIAARTIKPDNSIIELKKSDVFERTIVRASGVKLKAKSFAMPAVEVGSIIEYRWRETRNDQLANYIRLQFQRDVPVQLVTYHIKPLALETYGMRIQRFRGDYTPFLKEKDGFYTTSMERVPAFREEPSMPPESQVRPWMLVYYSEDKKLAPDAYWKEKGKEFYESFKSRTKISDEVKNAAATAIGDASTPEKKLEQLFEYCRAKIKNVNDDASGLTAEDRAKWKPNKSPADTLKRGMGTGTDIDMLFAALSTAAGFETRIVNLADRSDTFFDPTFPDDYFISTYDVAVRVGDGWRFYDPASTYVPHGMLRWQEEGEDALVADPKEPTWIKTPLSGPEKSRQIRTAKLQLSEDGTLEGDVRIEYTGHSAVERKEWDDDDSPIEREQTLRDKIKEQMSSAELSDIHIENVTDPIKPFVYAFHVRVPGYAQRTGKRLFLQPAFFQYGLGARFPTSGRIHPIYFHYPWSEEDEVRIQLPAGFMLDSPDAPAPFSSGTLSSYKVQIQVTKDQRELIYRRTFFFGAGGTGLERLFYDASGYSGLKAYFDLLHKQDSHTVTLKQEASPVKPD
ncbi:MAG: hypothetical protein QOD75_921 [Blastocatellia bacterium]|jgi:hypothetical protein|nr:hypothetical protein [Blastocatellia bacterium]